MIFVENLLHGVVPRHIPKPPIQLDKKDGVNFPGAAIIKQAHQGRTLFIRLSGADSGVFVNAHHLHAVCGGICNQGFPLVCQGQAVLRLFFGRYPDVQCYTDA